MGNNWVNMVDPTGGVAELPNDHDYGNGHVWTDSDGSWTRNAETSVWEGMNGVPDTFGLTFHFSEVTVTMTYG